MAMKNKNFEELLQEITHDGYHMESLINDSDRYGIENHQERQTTRRHARYRMAELERRNISIKNLQYSFEDEDGIEWDFQYVLQFI